VIVLASASPRRRELLRAVGLDFRVEPADIEEVLDPALSPDELARSLAVQKARAVAGSLEEPAWVIGADTVVAVPASPGTWKLLGKPETPAEARGMLALLSRTRHQVVTGVCVLRTSDGQEDATSETTWVTMREIQEAEIEAYVASGEWRDKAGGYAIQETADAFVTKLEGGFDTVVGLPVQMTLSLLQKSGALAGDRRQG